MRNHRRWLSLVRCVVLAVLVVGALASAASAASSTKWKPVTAKTKLKIGDRVRVNWHGDWVTGTITDFTHFGKVRVKFIMPSPISHEMTWPFDRSELRVRVKSRGSSKKNPFSAGSGNPFEPDKGFRTWKDDTGEFKIEAELIEIEDDAVRLKRRDGRKISVPIDRLCEEDRRLVKRLQGKDDEDGDDEDRDDDEEEDEEDEEMLTTREPNWESAVNAYLSDDVDPSGIKPDGGNPARGLAKRAVRLPPKEDFFDKAKGLCSASAAPNMVMLPFARSGRHNQPTRIVLCNLAKGKHRSRSIKFPESAVAIDLGPSGERVLSRPNGFGFGAKARVDLWKLDKGKLVHEFGWKPYGNTRMRHDSDVEWATFVDKDHVLTSNDDGKLVLWKLPEVEAVYTVKTVWGSRPALSPGHKYLAVLTPIGVGVLDAKTGELMGSYEGGGGTGTLAFRPDGKRLALLGTNRLVVWDLNNPKPYRDIGLAVPSARSSKLAWPAANYILVSGRYLVDVDKYVVLWDYQGGSWATSVCRQFWWLCDQRDSMALVPQAIPHKGAITVAKRIKPSEIRGIEPGDEISLTVTVSVPAERQRQIREEFERQLKSRGMKLVSNSSNRVIVRTMSGGSQKIIYEEWPRFGPHFGPYRDDDNKKTIDFQKQISEVVVTIDGKEAWKASCVVGAPHMVHVERGETTEQAVRKHQKPNVGFLESLQIPAYIPRPRKDVSFGASKLSPNGLLPGEVQPRNPVRRKPNVRPSGGDRRA